MYDDKILAIIVTIILIVTLTFSGCMDGSKNNGETKEISFEHPETVSIDQSFSITINGLPDEETFYLNISSQDHNGENWSYIESFQSNEGSLSLSETETMSMIQKMEPVNETYLSPYSPPIDDVDDRWDLTVSVEQDNEILALSNITRTYGDPAVTHHTVENKSIIGKVFLPPGEGPAPGVVVLHGSGGSMSISRAQMLASNGFVALAIQYFGTVDGKYVEQIPLNLNEVPIEYVKKSGEWLLDHERVKGEQVGVYGVSKGGELALLSASHFDIFGPTVSISGSGIVWESISRFSSSSSWSYQGEPVPYVPYSSASSTYSMYSLEDVSEETIKNATIPVENINGPVLTVSGGKDGVWNSVKFTSIAMDRLKEHDFAYENENMIFEDAGHAIIFPYRPTANRQYGDQLTMGGTSEGYMEADSEHWPRVLEVLGRLDS